MLSTLTLLLVFMELYADTIDPKSEVMITQPGKGANNRGGKMELSPSCNKIVVDSKGFNLWTQFSHMYQVYLLPLR